MTTRHVGPHWRAKLGAVRRESAKVRQREATLKPKSKADPGEGVELLHAWTEDEHPRCREERHQEHCGGQVEGRCGGRAGEPKQEESRQRRRTMTVNQPTNQPSKETNQSVSQRCHVLMMMMMMPELAEGHGQPGAGRRGADGKPVSPPMMMLKIMSLSSASRMVRTMPRRAGTSSQVLRRRNMSTTTSTAPLVRNKTCVCGVDGREHGRRGRRTG